MNGLDKIEDLCQTIGDGHDGDPTYARRRRGCAKRVELSGVLRAIADCRKSR